VLKRYIIWYNMGNEANNVKQQIDIVRYWKDSEFRASLSKEQLADLPNSPVGYGDDGLDFNEGVNQCC